MFKKIALLVLALLMVLSIGSLAQAAPSDKPGAALFHKGAPSGIVPTPDGHWLITDIHSRVIWLVKEGHAPQIFAGRTNVTDINGRPVPGYHDAPNLSAAFHTPWAIAPFLEGWLVSDTENHVVRYVSDTAVQTAIGSTPGIANGKGLQALLRQPTGLAVDEAGNAYIADTGNNVIRKLDKDGNVTTFAGVPWYSDPVTYENNFQSLYASGFRDGAASIAKFNQPTGLYWHKGSLYVADSGNHKIRKITNGQVSTVAGITFPASEAQANVLGFSVDAAITGGYKDGAANTAEFSNPQGVLVADNGTIYIADTGNSAVRVIKDGNVTTMLSPDLSAGDTYPISPRGLAMKNNVLYIADTYAGIVFSPLSADKTVISFTDVPNNAWYANAVINVSTLGIMNGTGNNMFSPMRLMDRAMTIRSLANFHLTLVDSNATLSGNMVYADTPADAYYTTAVNWAAQKDIKVRSTNNLFLPNQPISREEFVMLLHQYAKSIGLDIASSADAIDGFGDIDSISADARTAVAWAVSKGIMAGTGSNLNPLDTLTRAEIAQFFTNFCKAYNY